MLIDAPQTKVSDFKAHKKISEHYGVKAAGLSFIPVAWRLEFAALSKKVHQSWTEGQPLIANQEFVQLQQWLSEKAYGRVILRSSGTSEIISDRGKFDSIVVEKGWGADQIASGISKIYEHAKKSDYTAELGIVVQEYCDVLFSGHLSNEHRVSPTKNQWSYELEKPEWAPAKGINSKFKTAPDPMARLYCGNRIPHQPLRSVAHFLATKFKERCHLEWFVHNSTLFIAQIDFEWPAVDPGLDPRKDIRSDVPAELNIEAMDQFSPYEPGKKTKWPKLQNLTDFDFETTQAPPKIYSLSPKLLKEALQNGELLDKIKQEMVCLTGDKLVVRTDCIQKNVKSFNLPRTDTMNVKNALKWCSQVMSKFQGSGILEKNYVFLFHAFLPAKAAAWAYAQPNNPTVIVDALWGLPDGLQVLPVDTYEINVIQKIVVQTKTTYKPKFLTELSDGKWDYRSVKSQCGRQQVLSRADKLEIAIRTAQIATKLNTDAQIMWFCEIPPEYHVGRNLPWFRSREILDPSPRQEVQYRPISISKPSDLKKLPNGNITLKVLPEASLIRDEAFLDQIIEVAQNRALPVQIEGSILGHAFYRLDQAGIPVVLSNAPKYYRKRNKQVFGKLVRDKIPAYIAKGGENVKEAKLAKADLPVGLSGKLLEEMEEFLRATDKDEQAAEIADMLEVIKGLATATDHSWSKIEKLAKEKAKKRGGFKEGRVLIETTLPHRNSPLERQELVRATDLGAVECKKSLVEIPSNSLVATATGSGVIFSFDEDTARFRVSVKNGAVQIAKLDATVPEADDKQASLF
jgi:predicted house-cleaning noncanonical NTP pyrophosphatase (MazG superfamily)